MTFVLWVIGAAAFLWLGAVFGAVVCGYLSAADVVPEEQWPELLAEAQRLAGPPR